MKYIWILVLTVLLASCGANGKSTTISQETWETSKVETLDANYETTQTNDIEPDTQVAGSSGH